MGMENFIEQLVGEYYKTKGHLVTTNYWIPFKTQRDRIQQGKSQNYKAQSWTDIDVLARNKEELLIIQVKAIINSKEVAEKIILYFERIDDFLNRGLAPDNNSRISWWTENCQIRKIVVVEDYSPPSYLKIITDAGIAVKYFKEYLNDIVNYIKEKEGVKEENAVMRLLHFLDQNKLIDTTGIRKR